MRGGKGQFRGGNLLGKECPTPTKKSAETRGWGEGCGEGTPRSSDWLRGASPDPGRDGLAGQLPLGFGVLVIRVLRGCRRYSQNGESLQAESRGRLQRCGQAGEKPRCTAASSERPTTAVTHAPSQVCLP